MTLDFETARLLKRSLPLFATLAATLLVLAGCAILSLGREIFVPVALAALLSFVLAPFVRVLQRLSLPQGFAVLVTVLTAFAVFGVLAVLVGSELASLGADLPRYQGTIKEKIGSLGGGVASGGTLSQALAAIQELGRDLSHLGGSAGAELATGAGADARPIPVVVRDGSGLIGTVGLVVSPLLHPLATTGLVLVFTVFTLAAREDLRNRFVRLVGADDMQRTTAVIDDAGRRLSRLFLMQLAVNACFGAVIAAGLWAIGIPSPILWGMLAGILRFVPYIGAVIGALPPLALALAVDPGWSMLLWTVLLFLVVEPALGHVLEPLLFGHSTGLSPIAVILSATVWTFLWGPIGLVLATPITVCLVVLGRHIKELSFVDIVLGDQPALSPPQIFYQRMLARDPSEAVLQARQFLRERALSTYYDEVALEAIRLAHEDVARGRLSPPRQEALRHSTESLVGRLDGLRDPRPHGGKIGTEAAAAVLAAGPDRGAATEVLAPDDLNPDWRGDAPVMCLARPGTLDAVIAGMLAQVLGKHGIPARMVLPTAPEDCTGHGHRGVVRMVFLSYVEPLSTLHLRHAVRMARRAFPGASVVLGIWRERDLRMGRALEKAARADAIASTIGSALLIAMRAARRESLGSEARPIQQVAARAG